MVKLGELATHSSILGWRIPGTEEPTGLLSMGLHRVGHNWSDLAAAASENSWGWWPVVSLRPLMRMMPWSNIWMKMFSLKKKRLQFLPQNELIRFLKGWFTCKKIQWTIKPCIIYQKNQNPLCHISHGNANVTGNLVSLNTTSPPLAGKDWWMGTQG